jgi:cytochrome d ubiquinol oxidase subunit I
MALPHVLAASLWAGGFVLMGGSAYHLFRKTGEREFFFRSLRLGVVTAFFGSLLAVSFGYAQFAFVGQVQPDKWGASPLAGIGLGLMILIGETLQLLTMFVLLPLLIGNALARWRWIHPFLMAIAPLPFLAAVFGWLAREEGRQPWLVYGRLRVADALTPGLTGAEIAWSFIGFVGVLGALAVLDYVLIARAVRRGPGQVALGAPDIAPELVPAGSL